MKIRAFENDKFVYISVESKGKESLSWEELQEIKDRQFSHLDFY